MRDIASRATPLFDRRSAMAREAPGVGDSAISRRRLGRWRSVLGSRSLLDRRLRRSAIATDQLEALRGAQDANGADLPAWTWTLGSCLSSAPSGVESPGVVSDRSLHSAEPLPFEDVVVGFVRHARARFAAEAGAAAGALRPSALRALERQLLAHLTFVASMAIGRDFYEYRFAHAPAAALEAAWFAQQPSTDIYRAYVCEMHRGRLAQLLDAYPVLARLMSQSVEQWITTSATFCRRFGDDFAELRRCLGLAIEAPSDAVVDVRTGLSDRHHGGQTVLECILSTGERVIYKPRGVQPEASFFRFVRFLNEHRVSMSVLELRVLDRSTHGWVEWAQPGACRAQSDVEAFYRRAGMLLALAHVLGLNDVHCDNLIASGDQPVIVDLETLACETPRGGEPSVEDTGMLPGWREALDGRRFDLSALGADAAQDPELRVPSWRAVNTDQMSLSDTGDAVVTSRHRVRVGGRCPSIAEHLPAFLGGFREAYFCLMRHAREIMDDPKLLGGIDGLQLRVLVRDTTTYAELQVHLLHPEFLRDGIDRSIELDWLARPIAATEAPEAGRVRLYERERAAMENLDIPRFTTSDWADMRITSEDEDLFLLSGERDSGVIRRRLAGLSAADHARQRGVVESAVRSRFGSS